MRAAPLKQDRRRQHLGVSDFPLSNEGGPIEASRPWSGFPVFGAFPLSNEGGPIEASFCASTLRCTRSVPLSALERGRPHWSDGGLDEESRSSTKALRLAKEGGPSGASGVPAAGGAGWRAPLSKVGGRVGDWTC